MEFFCKIVYCIACFHNIKNKEHRSVLKYAKSDLPDGTASDTRIY